MTGRTLLKRAVSILIAGTLAFGAAPAYAADLFQETGSSGQTAEVSGVWTLDLWHYSGGYWKVGNKGSEKIRIEDAQIASLDSYLQANQEAAFTVTVPRDTMQLLQEGTRGTDWEVSFADHRGRNHAMLFAESSPKTLTVKGATQLEFTATPIFRFNSGGVSLRDYVSGMSVAVPLVDRKYGYNIYSVFGNGVSAVQGLGYYNEDDPSDIGRNAIHPSMILNRSGELEGGHSITLGMDTADSAGYTIGSGTFAAAGACGLHFEFPVSLVFTDLRAPQGGADPGDGTGPGGAGEPGGGADPGSPGGPSGDGAEDGLDPGLEPGGGQTASELQAVLDLPSVAYAGHDVPARDCSLFTIDGALMTASRAAELGIGKSSFAIVEKGAGSIRRSGKTGAVAVFTKPGAYQVKLTASGGGLTDTDTQSIRILKTPSIQADLGGVQKENRKQTLRITVAQDPRDPVNELSIRLTDTASGESVYIEKQFSGRESAPANSSRIKYRSLYDTGSDDCFLCVELDFLTKWHETRKLRYEVRAKDSAGGSDSVSGEFTVAPDRPPAAAIGLEDVYYRDEGSRKASVTAQCLSTSDGDALRRTWQYRLPGGSWQALSGMPGFTDLSFGSCSSVRFSKEGVGPFELKLTVKDLWTEETLEEYITEADYLSSSVQKGSAVDNVAPRVSLEMLRTETAEIFILTESDKASTAVMERAPSLKAALLSEGIAAEIRSDFTQAAAGAVTGRLKELTTGGVGGRNYRSSDLQLYSSFLHGMWDGGNILSDGRCTYMLQPTCETYSASPGYSIHTYPFTLTARDAAGKTVWSSTVTKSILDSPTYLRDAVWGLDADGTYLYLMDSGKTALFDIRTGTYVATLPCTLGAFNLVTDEHIYAFKDTGIWRVPLSGGRLVCVYASSIACPAFVGGSVRFLVKQDLGSGLGLYLGTFEPAGESVSCRLLEGSLSGYARNAEGLAIDAAGALFVRSGSYAYCFDADGLLIRQIALSAGADSIEAVFPVWRGDGQVRYLGHTGLNRTPKSRETWCWCYGVYTDEVFRDSRSREGTYPNYGKPVVYAVQNESGAIGIYLGGSHVYSTRERYVDAVLFTFGGEFPQPMGFPMEQGSQSVRYLTATANMAGVSDTKQIVHVSESPADEEARLKARNLSYDKNYSYYMKLAGAQNRDMIAQALDSAGEAVKAMKDAGENAAAAQGGPASLTRSISLAPDTTYYYEYDTTAGKDILSIEGSLAVPSGMRLQQDGYAAAASYRENFDDETVERFFTADQSAILSGRYRIGHLHTKSEDSVQVQRGTSANIRFTVPAGYKALLETDYEFDCYSDESMAKYLTLSGGGSQRMLEIPAAGLTRASGSYMHPSLLEPGTYTLSCTLRDRTKSSGRESVFWIDDLRVHLLVPGAPGSPAGWQDLQQTSKIVGEGTMRRVTGSFTTPRQVLHYGIYDAQRSEGLRSAFTALSESTAGSTKTVALDLNIPAGRQLLYAVLRGTGKGGSYTSGSGAQRYYSTGWYLDDVLQGVNTQESGGTLALSALPDEVRFAWRGLSGHHRVTASSHTRYGGSAGMDSLVLYLSREGSAVPVSMAGGRFFEQAQKLYTEDLGFAGSGRLTLQAEDGTAIRNLRVWTASKDAQALALDCSFKNDASLENWSVRGPISIVPLRSEKEEPARVYAKGETIRYQVFYGDWEHDPSKKQHWVYTHEPLSDGLHPQAGIDLPEPITRFWVDGKYTATHWQEDSTGTASYDKASNRVSITFYVEGSAANDAPWVKNIKTDPGTVKAGNVFTVRAAVGDKEQDALTVTVEVYKDSGSTPIGRKTVRDLKPDGAGNYPDVVLSGLPKAEPGTYDVVVSVTDGAGADVDQLRFKVKEEKSLTGTVTHTPAWEANRLAWNKAKSGTDAVRAANVFWPGETLVLNAPAGGEPLSVDAQILQFPQYAARLTRGRPGADGKIPFSGTLWHSSMLQTIGTAKPVPATVRFTARYADGEVLTWDVAIVFDQSKGSYYQLHRNY